MDQGQIGSGKMPQTHENRSELPLVSVIVPVHNGAEFIGEAVDSASLQTHRNLEIIVVDDGSTDGTLAILQQLATRDSRIRVFSQPNGGVASARNYALSQARGEFIAPLDADDLWLPQKIERQLLCLLASGEDTGFVYCWWAWIDETGTVLDRSPRWTIAGDKLPELILINFTGNASVPLFRKRCLVEAGGYNSQLAASRSGGCEDWEVVLRVAAQYRVAVVEDVLLGYRRRPGSMSQACDTMWRSQQMVMKGVRELRPELPRALFQGSEHQFSMYLAGLSYWSGNLRQSVRWSLRAGFRLPILLAPWIAKMMVLPRRKPDAPLVMRPGEQLRTASIANPLLPYDVILSPAKHPARLLQMLLGHPFAFMRDTAHRSLQALLIACIRREAKKYRALGHRRPRVLATACWHFPVYSQTFVYRELLALVDGGFDVRMIYGGVTKRSNLPDDLLALWPLRRRILYTDATATDDLHYFERKMPRRVLAVAEQISEASGLSLEQVYGHRHFRHSFSFARLAEAWEPDYIHTYFFYEGAVFGFVASQLLGIPRGVSCYADHMVDDYELKIVRLHMASSDVVVATSALIKRELELLSGRCLPCAIVKPNAIDSTRFAARTRPPSGAGRVFRGVAVNRIHAKKGVTYLVEAALLLRDRGIRFVIEILGEYDTHDADGPAYFARLQEFVARHRLEQCVIFRGRQTASEVRQHLSEKDIFVAPFVELTNGDKDGIPTALLEAMAAGCAIVVTDAGSITEVIHHEVEGLMVPQCDAEALADAIARLMVDDALRGRLSQAAIARVQRDFDVSHCEAIFHQRVHAALAARTASPKVAVAQ